MKRKKMDAGFWILASLTAVLFAVAANKGTELPLQALKAAVKSFSTVWMELVIGFVLVGLIEVLISKDMLVSWLGSRGPLYGVLMGWWIGLILPGGPYVFFPLVAGLMHKGAPPGALIALATAKLLLNPIRMLAYEAPIVGWPFTLARLVPGLFVPPILGLIGEYLFTMLQRRSTP